MIDSCNQKNEEDLCVLIKGNTSNILLNKKHNEIRMNYHALTRVNIHTHIPVY